MRKSTIYVLVSIVCFSGVCFAKSIKPLASIWTAIPGRPQTVIVQYDMRSVNFHKVGQYLFLAGVADGEAYVGRIYINKVAPNQCYKISIRGPQPFMNDMTDPYFCTTRNGNHLEWFSQMLFNQVVSNQTLNVAKQLAYVQFE